MAMPKGPEIISILGALCEKEIRSLFGILQSRKSLSAVLHWQCLMMLSTPDKDLSGL